MMASTGSNFHHFVRRIQARDNKRQSDQCLDFFLSKPPTNQEFDKSQNNDASDLWPGRTCLNQTKFVRLFLTIVDCENQYCHFQQWVKQINALPTAVEELQIHVSLDDCDESEENKLDSSDSLSDLAALLHSIQTIFLRNITNAAAAKLMFYAKEQHRISREGPPNGESEYGIMNSWIENSTFSKSSIEKLRIVLVTSSIFTSFAPSHGDYLPKSANFLIQRLLRHAPCILPRLQHICVECDKIQCWATETNYAASPTISRQWLDEIEDHLITGEKRNSWNIACRPLSLETSGWKMDWSSIRGLCRILRASETGETRNRRVSSSSLYTLVSLTLSNCRWALELRNNDAKNIHDPSTDLQLVQALAVNTSLRSLCLNLSVIPSQVFSWKDLPRAFAVHPNLKSFRTTLCMKELAFASLLRAYHESSLEEITIPFFFGTWTEELLGLLRKVLFERVCGLTKIFLRLQHIPARWSTNIAPAHRRNVWSLWKEYLSSCVSDTLQDLVAINLTTDEHLDLISTLQHREHPLRSLRFHGCTSLATIVTLTAALASHNRTRVLPTYFEFQVWNGDELHATKTLNHLAKAIKNNYGILSLNLTCTEYSATPHANILQDIYKDSEAAACIRTILSLNNAGRRHMLQNPQSLILGTEILARVALQQSVDAIFHHVMEHPALLLGVSGNNNNGML
ncbi:hypothetical protein IV203_024231 [Nitzschia inconspicua]|uniref:Uncharacterized protein n=1 Tax=Nitzschia inconspicua TaxID=303405 RepID=A0A9K3KBX3_9STRA|nr:hypothetical protein IV203_024231 [Nitzschia inconspicua]